MNLLLILTFSQCSAVAYDEMNLKEENRKPSSEIVRPAIVLPDPNTPPIIKLELIPSDKKFPQPDLPNLIRISVDDSVFINNL